MDRKVIRNHQASVMDSLDYITGYQRNRGECWSPATKPNAFSISLLSRLQEMSRQSCYIIGGPGPAGLAMQGMEKTIKIGAISIQRCHTFSITPVDPTQDMRRARSDSLKIVCFLNKVGDLSEQHRTYQPIELSCMIQIEDDVHKFQILGSYSFQITRGYITQIKEHVQP